MEQFSNESDTIAMNLKNIVLPLLANHSFLLWSENWFIDTVTGDHIKVLNCISEQHVE